MSSTVWERASVHVGSALILAQDTLQSNRRNCLRSIMALHFRPHLIMHLHLLYPVYILTLTIVCPLISHITLGLGKPVTRQQNLAQSPSVTVYGSGLLTNTGACLGLSSSTCSSGTL